MVTAKGSRLRGFPEQYMYQGRGYNIKDSINLFFDNKL